MRRHMLVASLVATTTIAAITAVTPGAATAAPAATTAPAAVPANPAPTASPCVPASGPRRTVVVRVADDGRRICLSPLDNLMVSLVVDRAVYPDRANWWQPVTATGTALALRMIPYAPPAGETFAIFQAMTPGVATVDSTQNTCVANLPRVCTEPVRHWQVTVEVVNPAP